jgi:membrane dipeptidase
MVAHIDHVCELVGPDHVALGSDWYGGRTSLDGLEHIGKMPVLTRELVARGYPEDGIRKILGENWMRLYA